MKEQLKKYITISVREEQGKSFLKKEFNLDSQVNIDPVFLHTKKEWSSLTTPSKLIKEKYILVYFLVGAPILQKVIDKVKEKYKLPVVCLQLTAIKRIKADKYIFDAILPRVEATLDKPLEYKMDGRVRLYAEDGNVILPKKL